MPQCAAYGCKNRGGEETVSLHRFPIRNPKLLRQWVHNLGRKDYTPNKTSKLCSVHFLPACYKEDPYAKYGIHPPKALRLLKTDAIPTEFVHSQESLSEQTKRLSSVARIQKAEHRAKVAKILFKNQKETEAMPGPVPVPVTGTSQIVQSPRIIRKKTKSKALERQAFPQPSSTKQSGLKSPMPRKVISTLKQSKLEEQIPDQPFQRQTQIQISLLSGIKQTVTVPTTSNKRSANCYNQAKIKPPETSGCNLYSTIKTEPFVDPTLENVSSREVTLSHQFCKPGDQVKIEPPETSGCNLYSTIKTEPFVDPTLENVSSREVTLSHQFCEPGDQVNNEPPEISGCNLYSTIKIEPFVDPTLKNVASGDVTPSVQFCKPGEITLPKNLPMSPCQSTDEAFHVSQPGTATATKDISVQTDFDPSPLIVIDPSRVMVLDPSQVSDLHPSLIPGFNPADIPGFDPSQIPGYDPSQKYRAVYVNWKERVCGEPVEAMDGDLTETSDPQLRNELEQTPLQKLICSLENVKPNIEEVIRCTEIIQAARDEVVEALDSLKVPGPRSNDRQEFVFAMETMVEAASNNVLNMIKQLANTTRQQQTQFIHLTGFVQKIKKEQGEMEEELLKFRRVTLKVRCASKRKHTLAPEYRKTKFMKNNLDSYTDISKIRENVQTRQINTNDCSKKKGDKKSQCELCLSLPGPLETSVRHEFQNNRQSKDDRLTIKQIDNCGKITLIKKTEPSFPTNSQEFLFSNETDFQKDCG